MDLLNFASKFPAEFDWENYEWTEMYKRMAEKAPEVCPVCDHPQAYFQLEQNNF